MSMGQVIDTLEKKMKEILQKPSLILDKAFMMGIFDKFSNKLSEFKEYLEITFKKKNRWLSFLESLVPKWFILQSYNIFSYSQAGKQSTTQNDV